MVNHNGQGTNPQDRVLGTSLIESAVGMENALAGLLTQEAEKFRRFNFANPTLEQIAEFDGQLVAILQAVCCIEETVATKLVAGLILRGNDTP